ncbi:MAG: UDP-N-acetylglucosamine 2-epimerase (non-hydrolyzing), partial [Candidatus Zixiibacteriota bacterium]
VYGDTNSTLAGALAAAKHRIPVAHVEAGLRSFVKSMPEEINRVLTDHVSSLLFCPTPASVENLKREGITKGFHLVGDVMYDSLKGNLAVAERKSKIMKRLNLKKREFYLVTVHRAENTDDKGNLEKITRIVTNLGKKVVFPIHPRTRNRLSEFKLLDGLLGRDDLLMVDPVSYLDMLVLEKNARCLLTDSGGVQKEAFFLKTPCLTMREETEWVETVESGLNTIVGLKQEDVLRNLGKKVAPRRSVRIGFGDGKASQNIAKVLLTEFGG